MISDPLPRCTARPTAPRTARRATAAYLAIAGLAVAPLAGCSSSDAPTSTSPAGSTSWSVGTPTAPGGSAPGPAGASSWGTVGADGGAGERPSASGPPAQDPADAARDGIPPAAAALPSADRVRPVPPGSGGRTRVTTREDGTWLISRPAGSPPGYAEVLHLDGAGRIVRAYPFAGVAPQWLVVGPSAVYCGRHGDAAAPDAMVCRIDRTSGDLRVLVTAGRSPHTALLEGDVRGRPGTWVIDDSAYRADLGVAPQMGTELTFTSGGVLHLSPDTLGVLGS